MPQLSVKKLISLVEKKGYYCSKFFCYKKACVYIEILEKKSALPYMLYIPSNYDFIYENIGNKYEYYEISYLDYNSTNDIVDKYGKNQLLDKQYYDDIDVSAKYNESCNMEDKLTKKYENNIVLNQFKSGEHFDLRCIVRQLERLVNSVSKLDYKLCIFYKKYLCAIKRDNSIECFYVKQLHTNYRNILVSFDLEMMYNTTPEDIKIDLVQINESIYDIFEKNREKHLDNIFVIFERKGHIKRIYEKLLKKKSEYALQIINYQKLFNTINDKEDDMKERIKQYKDTKKKYANPEMNLAKIDKIKREGSKLLEIQNKIIVNMNIARQKYNDVLLTIDKILFDNIIMLDKIMKNFQMIDIMLDDET
jgi:hypothetical protein